MNKKIIDKIMKLIALSENNPNEFEAQRAKEKAAEMMAQYDIEIDQLKTDSSIETDIRELNSKRPVKYNVLLFNAISRFNGVLFLTRDGYGPNKALHYFVGRRVDIQNNDYMIDLVLNHRTIKWKEYLSFYKDRFGHPPNLKTRQDWMNSFAIGISRKIRELTQKKSQIIQERGLVVVDRADRALYEFQKTNGEVRNAKKRRISNIISHGIESGQSTPINKGVTE